MSRDKAALLVGIEDYPRSPLSGPFQDVSRLQPLLTTNQDGSPNFECITMSAPAPAPAEAMAKITRAKLRSMVHTLFSRRIHYALFYFAGHGVVTQRGGILVTQDGEKSDEGVPMEELLNLANQSSIDQITMILDCCYSGKLGENSALQLGYSSLREGISVIAASGSDERAFEKSGSGVFTSLLCSALNGGASDLLGNITTASVYSYIDQALTAWQQRPLFKANLSRLTPLRTINPPLPRPILRKLTEYFPEPEAIYPLDPSYEPDPAYKPPGLASNPAHEEIFAHLQKFRAFHLLVPEGEEHLFWAAIRSKGCRLTLLGQHYWQLAKGGRI